MRTRTVRYSSRWAIARRLIAVVVIATGGSFLATPAGAHTSTLCKHEQRWDKSNSSMWFGVGFVSDRNISSGHLNKYRHWRFYPSTGDIDVLHADVEKQCAY